MKLIALFATLLTTSALAVPNPDVVDATDCNVPGGCYKKREPEVASTDATDYYVPGGCYKTDVDATDCNVPGGCYKEKRDVDATDCNVPGGFY